MTRSATTTSPIDSAGSRPPATPEKTIVRQPNRSASSVVTIAALTFPIPEPASTTSWPSSMPVTNRVCATASVWVSARALSQGGEFLRDGADQSDGHSIRV